MTNTMTVRINEMKRLALLLEQGEVSWEACCGYSNEELDSFLNLTTMSEFTYE